MMIHKWLFYFTTFVIVIAMDPISNSEETLENRIDPDQIMPPWSIHDLRSNEEKLHWAPPRMDIALHPKSENWPHELGKPPSVTDKYWPDNNLPWSDYKTAIYQAGVGMPKFPTHPISMPKFPTHLISKPRFEDDPVGRKPDFSKHRPPPRPLQRQNSLYGSKQDSKLSYNQLAASNDRRIVKDNLDDHMAKRGQRQPTNRGPLPRIRRQLSVPMTEKESTAAKKTVATSGKGPSFLPLQLVHERLHNEAGAELRIAQGHHTQELKWLSRAHKHDEVAYWPFTQAEEVNKLGHQFAGTSSYKVSQRHRAKANEHGRRAIDAKTSVRKLDIFGLKKPSV